MLIEILAYLPAADMIAVQRTCRTIRDIVAGTAYLQYILHTEINGVNDLLPPDFPYSERLELLRCHERSWRDLQSNLFAEPHSICVHNLKFFTLQDGYLSTNATRDGEGGACNMDIRTSAPQIGTRKCAGSTSRWAKFNIQDQRGSNLQSIMTWRWL